MRTPIKMFSLVRMVTPRAVARVGYARDFDETVELLKRDHDLYRRVEAAVALFDPTTRSGKVFDRFRRAAAYAIVAQSFDTDKERRIHFVDVPHLAGVDLRIVGRSTAQTGQYYPPGGSDDDYEPGGLDHRVHHTLLHVVLARRGWGNLTLDQKNVRDSGGWVVCATDTIPVETP